MIDTFSSDKNFYFNLKIIIQVANGKEFIAILKNKIYQHLGTRFDDLILNIGIMNLFITISDLGSAILNSQGMVN